MTGLKSVLIATIAGGIISASLIASASAMPAAPLRATAQANSAVQEARYVCGPYRCWYRPNYYAYYAPRPYYYGPRFYGPGYGYHRGWRHW
ncbi:MAG TPA: hypothetical protein VH206_11310 [Xanthobacteraceae bacterium]|jgi:hypothetical protein|nr:hypothetical protein [Xanthobacteraceae bacterium]